MTVDEAIDMMTVYFPNGREDCELWFEVPNKGFGFRTPRQVVEQGEFDSFGMMIAAINGDIHS